MKRIETNTSYINLPEAYEELSPKQLLQTMRYVRQYHDGKIAAHQLRLSLLYLYTDYRPNFNFLPDPGYTVTEMRKNIEFNLVRLSEEITFPFGPDGKRPNNCFNRNPVPFIKTIRRRRSGLQFNRGLIVDTNISADQFATAYMSCDLQH